MTRVHEGVVQHQLRDFDHVRDDETFEAVVKHIIARDGAAVALDKIYEFMASQGAYLPEPRFLETIFRRATRKQVLLTKREMSDVVDEAIEAVGSQDIYQRGNNLVDFVRSAEPSKVAKGHFDLTGLPKIRKIPAPRLRETLNEAAEFRLGDGSRCAAPPKWIVDTMLARGEWRGIRPLVGVTPFPLLRPDGTVLDDDGYDVATGLYYVGTLAVNVPASPTKEDAQRALAEILEVVVDFPFKDEAAKAGYVSALLTPLARYAIEGPTPLFCFDANTPGSGKGLLADTIGYIILGRDVPKGEFSQNEEELAKRLSTLALKGAAVACFDNVKSTIGGAILELLITSITYEGRKLGSLDDFEMPWRTTLYATLNNGTYSPDMIRRSIVPKLESPYERPEEREGLRDLPAYCQKHRARLLRAALVILRAYQAAGRPGVRLKAMGSFERWSAVVRAPIVWLGMPDPVDTQVQLRDVGDPEREALELLLETWFDTFGETKRTAVEVLAADAMTAAVAAFAEFKAYDDANARAVLLGKKLRSIVNRPAAGLKLVSHKKTKHGIPWSVVCTAPSGTP
jgi:hypothetical protein